MFSVITKLRYLKNLNKETIPLFPRFSLKLGTLSRHHIYIWHWPAPATGTMSCKLRLQAAAKLIFWDRKFDRVKPWISDKLHWLKLNVSSISCACWLSMASLRSIWKISVNRTPTLHQGARRCPWRPDIWSIRSDKHSVRCSRFSVAGQLVWNSFAAYHTSSR